MSANDAQQSVGDDSDEGTEYQVITHADIVGPLILYVWADMKHDYYLTVDWSYDFYVDLAYQGFIAVAQDMQDRQPLLIPQIQRKYCILDFPELHIGKSVRNKCKRGYRFRVNSDMPGVLKGIQGYHNSNWVIPPYQEMLLHLQQAACARSKFHAVSVELLDDNGNLVAGEVGYTIGRTYTSLTGFFDRRSATDPQNDDADAGSVATAEDDPDAATDDAAAGVLLAETLAGDVAVQKTESSERAGAGSVAPLKSKGNTHNSAGKVQLVALGRFLQRSGIAFWNLGHPPRPESGQMVYKSEIGGKVLSRKEFLGRWCAARDDLYAGLPAVDCAAAELVLGAAPTAS